MGFAATLDASEKAAGVDLANGKYDFQIGFWAFQMDFFAFQMDLGGVAGVDLANGFREENPFGK